ncbi:MAG: diguanylate cyclase [Candidatus Electrothrix sp. ATG2]|nr:diguanylate cyclase [Candidatus Electrothrix sp. ATG2]
MQVTVSIGAACLSEYTQSPQMLLQHADTALYSAKRSGRNQVRISQLATYNVTTVSQAATTRAEDAPDEKSAD